MNLLNLPPEQIMLMRIGRAAFGLCMIIHSSPSGWLVSINSPMQIGG